MMGLEFVMKHFAGIRRRWEMWGLNLVQTAQARGCCANAVPAPVWEETGKNSLSQLCYSPVEVVEMRTASGFFRG
jgi:hypothetical protein